MAFTDYRNVSSFSIAEIIDFITLYYIDGGPYSFSGDISLNTEAQWEALTWTDVRPQPLWTDLLMYYTTFLARFNGQPVTYLGLQQFWENYTSVKADSSTVSALSSSLSTHTGSTSNPHSTTAAQVGLGNANNTADTAKPVSTAQTAAFAPISHVHAESDITGLVADLAARAFGAGILIKQYSANSTSSGSEVVLNLTNDATTSGTNLWSTSTVPSIIILPKKGATITDPNQIFNACEEAWSNGNKTVSVIVAKGTSTGILVGGTVNSAALVGSGVTVDILVIGLKA